MKVGFRRPHPSFGLPNNPGGADTLFRKAKELRSHKHVDRGRPVAVVGMNHPLYTDPRKALWPDPGSSGGHLYEMLRSRTGCTVQDYLQTFQRFNLVSGPRWDDMQGLASWQRMEADLIENFDCIILLGRAVRRCAGIRATDEIIITPNLICLPHPSGLNRWYNDPINRAVVEILLEEVYTRAVGG